MKIVVKDKYKDSSVHLPFGKSLKLTALKDLTETQRVKFFRAGYTNVFEDLDEKKTTTKTKTKKKNDKNNSGNDSIGVSNTDREGDTK